MGQAPTVRVLNDVDETIRELSVRVWRSVCAEHKNVGAILVIARYSVIALLLMRQFVNCLYVVEAWASGCVRDRSGYETLNQLRITNGSAEQITIKSKS